MQVFEAIKSRKSVRSFTGESITETELQAVLTAAQASPVGMGAYENIHLTVISNEKLLADIDENAAKTFNRDGHMLYGAPLLVLVSSRMAGTPMDSLAWANAATIAENMVLEAIELGIGVCHIFGATMALAKNAELTARLSLPDGFAPLCGVILGRTAETYAEREIPSGRMKVTKID